MSGHACYLCDRPLEPQEAPGWDDPSQTVVTLPKNYVPCARIEAGRGVLLLCEPCYQRGDFSRLEPDDLYEVHYSFGLEYLTLERLDEALGAFQRAAGVSEGADVLAMIASIHGQRGETQRQLATYERALRLEPQDVLLRRGLTTALADSGRHEEALYMLDEDIRRLGPLSDLMMERAELLLRLGQANAALLAFEAAKASADNDEDRNEFALRWQKLAG